MTRVPPHMTRFARQLRREATPAERKLWHLLAGSGLRFTRQLVVGEYIIDIGHRPTKLAIELDGSQHVDNINDVERTAWLEGLGWHVLRFWNNDVLANPEGVARTVLDAVARRLGQLVHPRTLGSSQE